MWPLPDNERELRRLSESIAPPDTTDANPKRRFGDRKPSPHLIPPVALIEEASVFKLGAAKYGAYNWTKEPVSASTYYSAAMRHLMQWFAGEDIDPESGCHHLAHVRACAAIVLDCANSDILQDDRPAGTSSASEAIKRLSQDRD